MVVHICNPSTQVAKAGETRFQGQPELHSKTLYQKKNERKQNKVKISK
jgi:hypothetical protein